MWPNSGKNPKYWIEVNTSNGLSKKIEIEITDIMAWGLINRQDQAMILKQTTIIFFCEMAIKLARLEKHCKL